MVNYETSYCSLCFGLIKIDMINSPWGFLHATKDYFCGWLLRILGLVDGVFVRGYAYCNFNAFFFSLLKVLLPYLNFHWNTLLFLIFHMVKRTATSLSGFAKGLDNLKLWPILYTHARVWWHIDGKRIMALCYSPNMSSNGIPKDRCSASSISTLQWGRRVNYNSFLRRVPLVRREALHDDC